MTKEPTIQISFAEVKKLWQFVYMTPMPTDMPYQTAFETIVKKLGINRTLRYCKAAGIHPLIFPHKNEYRW